MGVWSEADLLRGMRAAEERPAAFRALHQQYGPRLLGFLIRMCHGDRDLAEDLLGRALYKAYVSLAQPRTAVRSLPAWLYTIASRTALDHLQAAATRDLIAGAESLDERHAEPAPITPSNPVDAVLDETVELVLAQLEAEDPRYRTLLEMEHVGACDRGEIAEATGIPRKQITQYLKRARQRFIHHARQHPILADWEHHIPEGASK